MNIYFAGSIRGGRQDADRYQKIIEALKQYGTVLTEHVGYLEQENQKQQTDAEIYAQDMRWLQQSDILIGEVTTPSLGVGYEMGQAVAMGKTVVALYLSGHEDSISAMIKGAPGITCHAYQNLTEAKQILAQLFQNL